MFLKGNLLMKKQIRISDLKQALHDYRFREKLPTCLDAEVQAFLTNPGCACNQPLYKKLFSECQDQLSQYYPDLLIAVPEESSHWQVINCHIDLLEKRLRTLPIGNKKITISRWEDQITAVVNFSD